MRLILLSLIKLIPMQKSLGLIALALALVVSSFYYGKLQGKEVIQAKWNKERIEQLEALKELQAKNLKQEKQYRAELQKITDQMHANEVEYEKHIASLSGSFNYELQQSKARADYYQSQARKGTSECKRLADHAARLDKSLVEGIRLVEELKTTVIYRDSVIKQLGILYDNSIR